MKRHDWSEADADGVESCREDGCTVRVYSKAGMWQLKKGAHWRRLSRQPVPECTGTARAATPDPMPLLRVWYRPDASGDVLRLGVKDVEEAAVVLGAWLRILTLHLERGDLCVGVAGGCGLEMLAGDEWVEWQNSAGERIDTVGPGVLRCNEDRRKAL